MITQYKLFVCLLCLYAYANYDWLLIPHPMDLFSSHIYIFDKKKDILLLECEIYSTKCSKVNIVYLFQGCLLVH